MNELNNIRLVHKDAYSPDPIYASRPLEWFVGRWVKIGFQSYDGTVEYMWVKVTGIDSPNLVGSLDNIPQYCPHVASGDRVTLSRVQIVAVDLTEDEWWEEVSMLRAKGDFFNRHLGSPGRESGFVDFYPFGFTPRQALNRWAKWQPGGEEPLKFLLDIAANRTV